MMNLSDKIKFTFNNVTLLGSNWIIHGFYLKIKDTNFSGSHILIDKTKEYETIRTFVIVRSIFGYLKSSGYIISISECIMNDNATSEQTLINIDNSNFYMITDKVCSLYVVRNNGEHFV